MFAHAVADVTTSAATKNADRLQTFMTSSSFLPSSFTSSAPSPSPNDWVKDVYTMLSVGRFGSILDENSLLLVLGQLLLFLLGINELISGCLSGIEPL